MRAHSNDVDERLLIYFEDETDIVRRLGAAAISCWRRLPKATQTMLREQSLRVFDDDETPDARRRLDAFIKQHTLKPPAARST
jgi:hypothetical protein